MSMMSRRALLTVLAFGVVVVLAAGYRLYDIGHYPPGLFPDEAANGEDVLLILDGDLRPFYPRGNGREALFFFLQALSVKLFGIGVWQMHSASAAVGILTVGATYFATRVWFGRLAGVLAALLLATNHWHVTLSRTGFRAIMIPLFVAAFTAFVGYVVQSVRRGQKTTSLVYAVLAGAAFAGGFYAYIAYRMMVGVVAGIAVLVLLAAMHPRIGFPHIKRYWQQLVVAVVAAFIVLLPLGIYFAQHPDAFVGRAGQVSIFNRELQQEFGGGTLIGTLAYSTGQTLLSFFAGEGDLNWRHSVVGYPLLSPLVGLLFLLGLAWVIRGIGTIIVELIRGKEIHLEMIYPYVLLLLFGMLVPPVTTAEGMPHGLRSVGLIFPIFFLAGTAGAVVIHWVLSRLLSATGRAVGIGAICGVLVLGTLYDVSLYFLVARNDANAAYAYRADLTDVSAYILEHNARNPDAPRPYLVLDGFSLQTPHFLTHTLADGRIDPPPHDYVVGDESHPDAELHAYRAVDPAGSHLVNLRPGEIIIFTQSTIPDADRYAQSHPDGELLESRTNRFGQEIMRIYQTKQPGGTEQEAPYDLDA